MAKQIEYAVKNRSPNRATVCDPAESIIRWWGPEGHEIGDRIWHHGVLCTTEDHLAPAVRR